MRWKNLTLLRCEKQNFDSLLGEENNRMPCLECGLRQMTWVSSGFCPTPWCVLSGNQCRALQLQARCSGLLLSLHLYKWTHTWMRVAEASQHATGNRCISNKHAGWHSVIKNWWKLEKVMIEYTLLHGSLEGGSKQLQGNPKVKHLLFIVAKYLLQWPIQRGVQQAHPNFFLIDYASPPPPPHFKIRCKVQESIKNPRASRAVIWVLDPGRMGLRASRLRCAVIFYAPLNENQIFAIKAAEKQRNNKKICERYTLKSFLFYLMMDLL